MNMTLQSKALILFIRPLHFLFLVKLVNALHIFSFNITFFNVTLKSGLEVTQVH